MASSLRQLRERRQSVSATMKITKAMELIAASRVTRAQNQARRAEPYDEELVRAVSEVAAHTDLEHPLTTEPETSTRAAVLLITADKGFSGAFNSNVLNIGDGLLRHLDEMGKTYDLYVTGKRGVDFLAFREAEIKQSWVGISDRPSYADAKIIGQTLMDSFLKPTALGGVDELHLVFTRFKSMVSQQTQIVRLLPLEVVRETVDTIPAGQYVSDDYHFEPDAATVLDKLLPMYIINRIHFALKESAASELAARQQAMHSATENANELIEQLTRDANQARQAEITQEITEIVGGASALASS